MSLGDHDGMMGDENTKCHGLAFSQRRPPSSSWCSLLTCWSKSRLVRTLLLALQLMVGMGLYKMEGNAYEGSHSSDCSFCTRCTAVNVD
jgi:hypothetical protein